MAAIGEIQQCMTLLTHLAGDEKDPQSITHHIKQIKDKQDELTTTPKLSVFYNRLKTEFEALTEMALTLQDQALDASSMGTRLVSQQPALGPIIDRVNALLLRWEEAMTAALEFEATL
jgi:hypothetical protein